MSSSGKREGSGSVRFLGVCLSAVLVLLAVAGCSLKNQVAQKQIAVDETAVKGNDWPDQQLKDKFKEYWGYRCDGNADSAFALEAPYVREMISPERYGSLMRAMKDNQWTGIQIEKFEWVTDQLIYIDFYLKYKEKDGRIQDIFFRDPWIVLGSQWFHAFKDPFVLRD